MYIGDRQSMQNEIKNKIETKESEEKCVFLVNKYFLINPPIYFLKKCEHYIYK